MKHKVLKYDLIDAHFAGVENHPQAEMKRLGLDGYYKAVPESIGDCWFFLFDTWPQVELPSYLSKIEIDDNMAQELKMEPGDKVWLFMPTTQEITYARIGSETRVQKYRYISVRFRCGITLGGLKPGLDVFPTREALCEHYRKIFK